ncbi:uncharacterized protein LOC124286884 isoform X2 [Haliotis rubra]|uniref:uncharacterized protein LOC124286884 isoform X2 n=1 Tax=Haliotis rubra TaxID=36100 RepID=UPI001EE628C1|nr:uncharacterized protein LOC124286884 isoform X2 [Haliotis rubra]
MFIAGRHTLQTTYQPTTSDSATEEAPSSFMRTSYWMMQEQFELEPKCLGGPQYMVKTLINNIGSIPDNNFIPAGDLCHFAGLYLRAALNSQPTNHPYYKTMT